MKMVFEYKGGKFKPTNTRPKDAEIVDVYPCAHPGASHLFDVVGYEYSICGTRQGFLPKHFRPLDEVLSEISIEELTHQLVEKC